MTDDDDVPNFARARERVKAVLVEENLAGEDMVELLIDLIYRGVVTAGRWDWDKLARVIHLIRDRWDASATVGTGSARQKMTPISSDSCGRSTRRRTSERRRGLGSLRIC